MIDSDETPDRKEDRERVKAAVALLGEHFDSVHIFCSRHMPAEHNDTVTTNHGSGSWFARFGQIREWLIYEEEKIRRHARLVKESEGS